MKMIDWLDFSVEARTYNIFFVLISVIRGAKLDVSGSPFIPGSIFFLLYYSKVLFSAQYLM